MFSFEHTASAASRVQPPANTDKRQSVVFSLSVSRSYDQSTSARSVCWRGSTVREPPVSSRNRWFSRVLISPTGKERTRAAASSSASGMPSRRAQIADTAAAFSSVTRKDG